MMGSRSGAAYDALALVFEGLGNQVYQGRIQATSAIRGGVNSSGFSAPWDDTMTRSHKVMSLMSFFMVAKKMWAGRPRSLRIQMPARIASPMPLVPTFFSPAWLVAMSPVR